MIIVLPFSRKKFENNGILKIWQFENDGIRCFDETGSINEIMTTYCMKQCAMENVK